MSYGLWGLTTSQLGDVTSPLIVEPMQPPIPVNQFVESYFVRWRARGRGRGGGQRAGWRASERCFRRSRTAASRTCPPVSLPSRPAQGYTRSFMWGTVGVLVAFAAVFRLASLAALKHLSFQTR